MRVWLCLLGLGISCHCFDVGSHEAIVDSVLDLRTLYRKYLPDILTDVPDIPSDEDKSINLTAIQIKKNKTIDYDWSARREGYDDSDISESRRLYLRRMNPRIRNPYSWECNSSEYKEFQDTLERRFAIEANTTDVFEDDLDDLWDKYMANQTGKPGFNLAYSPRFMNQAFREYSLSVLNITIPTTMHWLLGPLTGSQGILYDQAMERMRKYKINKNNTKMREAARKYVDDELRGKNMNKTKDIVRQFIHLKRKLGYKLNWTIPPYSVSKELENMEVPDTEEIMERFRKEQETSEEDFPDIEKLLRENTQYEGDQVTTERITLKVVRKQKETEKQAGTYRALFTYQFNPQPRAKTKDPDNSVFQQDQQEPGRGAPAIDETTTTTEKHDATQKPETVKTTEPKRKTTPNKPEPITDQPSKSKVKEKEERIPAHHHSSSTKAQEQRKPTAASFRADSIEEKYRNHTAVKFLQKHKNKFLVGGIACLVAAKIFG